RTNRLDELFNSFINQQFFGDILRYVLCMNKYHLKTPKVNTLPRPYRPRQYGVNRVAASAEQVIASLGVRATVAA
nr:hypothetical protein [Nostoc indistinguendum CM1-VF10]